VKRREFVTLLGGAAAWLMAARPRQAVQMRGIGFLHAAAPNPGALVAQQILGAARPICHSLLVALCCLTVCDAAHADRRVALVIGNSGYQSVARLTNPANDAKLIAATLQSLGFALIGGGAQLDLDKAAIDRAVQSLGNELPGADVALFYYAGHGVQVRGSNYLVPVDANPVKEADVDFQMLDINTVLRQMESAGTKLNLVILDACRNNPFGGRGLRAAGSGLAQMRAPEGTLISFATQPGNVTYDGSDGNSPYTKSLAQAMRKPGLDVFKTFNEVGLAVSNATGGTQQPWVSLSPLKGDFYFAGLPTTAPSDQQAGATRFDGLWRTTVVCDKEGEILGWSQQFFGRIKNGVFHGQTGVAGQPGWTTYDGTIEPDGSIQLQQEGITGSDPNMTLGRTPPGRKYSFPFVGQFEGLRGSALRVEGRICRMDLVKQQ